MRRDPFKVALGVAADAGALELLGLQPERTDPVSVQAALRRRLERVFAAPVNAEEADVVRKRLRQAADELIAARRRPRAAAPAAQVTGVDGDAPPAPSNGFGSAHAEQQRADMLARLTDFDRQVLAVLISSGGWNAQAQARLVAMSAAHGVGASGLLRVVSGLSEYARAARAVPQPGSFAAPAPRPARRAARRPPAVARGLARVQSEIVERIAEEFQPRDEWATTKLALLFGFLTLLVGLLAVRFLFFPSDFERPGAASPEVATVPESTRPTWPAPPRTARTDQPQPQRLARFHATPTFQGHALSIEASRATEGIAQLPAQIQAIGRRVALARDDPSDAVFREWEAALSTTATAWILVERRLLDEVDAALLEVLFAASGSPRVTDRLLSALTPPSSRLGEPADLCRGAWMAGTLGRIVGTPGLPLAAVGRARTQLEIAMGPDRAEAVEDFDSAASAWLEAALAPLVELTEFDQRVYDFWEAWLAAERRLGRGERFNAALMSAVEALLRTTTDLAREGPSTNVLGRLLTTADFQASPVVHDRILAIFNETETISSHDLWVLTSLLAEAGGAPWFGSDLVVAEDADWMFRRRIADRLNERWPKAATEKRESLAQLTGIPVDRAIGARWLEALAAELGTPLQADTEPLLVQLVRAARLNEAAAELAAGNPVGARDLIEHLDPAAALGGVAPPGRAGGTSPGPPPGTGTGRRPITAPGTRTPPGPPAPNFSPSPGSPLQPSPGTAPGTGSGPGRSAPAPPPPFAPGQPLGRDGEWATAYEAAGRNTEARLEGLQNLLAAAGTDLGPIDAEAFVRVVYRGSPPEVREQAQNVLITRFTTGPIVALEMLDQFSGTAASEALGRVIEQLTGAMVPAPRSQAWAAETRLALVRHALRLRLVGGNVIDEQAGWVVQSYFGSVLALRGGRRAAAPPASPEEAAAGLVSAWEDVARSVASAAAPGDDPGELEHRRLMRHRLADGPLQSFVAAQLSILDLIAFVTRAEQPAQRDAIQRMLSSNGADRASLDHVLEQAVAVERAIAQVWKVRISIEEAPP